MQKIHTESHYTFRGNTIPWIEKLLETPIDDYRKNAVNLILAPYLINVKKLSYDAALNIINGWLSKCGEFRQLDQNFDYTVRYALKYSAKNGQRPLNLDTLKVKNKVLYDLLYEISDSQSEVVYLISSVLSLLSLYLSLLR
jgi:Primase X